MTKLLCLDATPKFLNAFDFSVAPSLLFYAYIPIVLVLLFLSFLIAFKDKFSLKSKILLTLGISFSLWVVNIIIQWTAVEADIVYFAWQMTALLEILIPLSTVYLVYVFTREEDVHPFLKLIFSLIIAVVTVLLPTSFNMYGFDIYNCQALVGPLTYYIYAFEILTVLWVFFVGLRRYRVLLLDEIVNKDKIKQLALITTSSVLFLLIFSLSNIAGEISHVYSINLFGPIGMVVFLTIISYMIVKFNTFNVKLIAAQALIWALTILIGAQFFFITSTANYFLNGFTFIATIILGNYLINSVKREVEQKEYLQILNVELKDLLKQRESLVHLITHKVKGSFTRSKYIFAEMVEGSFGELHDPLLSMAKKGLSSDNEGIQTVDLVLNSFNLSSGTVKYDMKQISFKDIVTQVISEKKSRAEDKGLKVEIEMNPEDSYSILGDAFWVKEVVNNFVENSIRYSLTGTIHIKLEKKDRKIVLSVKDNGVGLTDEDKKNLFTEGGRGKDSIRMNIDSTGYGLFSVKLIVQAHKGRVWAESEGKDKGSVFFVELDETPSN